jgi:hypothetical protein
MIADSLQVIHVIFLSILFGLLLCFAILFLLSFRTIICKLNVLFKHLLMQSYYKIFVHLEFVVPDGFMYAYCHF